MPCSPSAVVTISYSGCCVMSVRAETAVGMAPHRKIQCRRVPMLGIIKWSVFFVWISNRLTYATTTVDRFAYHWYLSIFSSDVFIHSYDFLVLICMKCWLSVIPFSICFTFHPSNIKWDALIIPKTIFKILKLEIFLFFFFFPSDTCENKKIMQRML